MTPPRKNLPAPYRITAAAILSAIFIFSSLAPLTGCVSNSAKDTGENASGSDTDLDGEMSAESVGNSDLVNEELSDSSAKKDSPAPSGEAKGGETADATLDGDLANPPADDASSSAMKDSLAEPPVALDAAPPAEATPPVADASAPSGGGESAAQEVTVTDIRYVSKKGGGTVVIDTSAPATYRTREVPSQNQVVIEIANAKLPDRLKLPYVTKDFKQSIEAINAYQDKGSNTARIVLQFKHPSKAAVAQSGKSLTIIASETGSDSGAESLAEGGNEGGLTTDNGSKLSGQQGTSENARDADGDMKSETADSRSTLARSEAKATATSTSLTEGNPDDMKFYGHPISLEFSDTPVREVIAMIAEQSGANIMISSEVDGNISLKLKQVPWDQALLLVMKTRGLGYVRQGNVLRVAPLAALQKETDEAHRIIEAQHAAEPLKVKVIPVSYAKVTDLASQVGPFLSTRGKATGDVRTSTLVVTDIPENLQRVANLVHALDTAPLQVLIEGKVVEARENFGRSFGIQWGYAGQAIGNGAVQLNHDATIQPGQLSAPLGKMDLSLGTLDIFGDISVALQIAETEDLARIISAPRILAMNNEQATITQKTSIPIAAQQVTAAGTTTTFSYKDIQMTLDVTPQITSDSDVIMGVHLTREFAANSTSTPPIESRDAKTRVLVRNGQTAVIGGVYQSDSQQSEAGIPYLREIPILGWLFKSASRSSQKNELLLFLTPRIMTPEKVVAKEGSAL